MTDSQSYPVTASAEEPFTFIDARLADLAEANALYGKDQRLGAPDKIARNDREISWLKDLRSIIASRTSSAAQRPMDRDEIAKRISFAHLGDDREWKGFRSHADRFLAYALPSTPRATLIDHSDEECPNFPGCHCVDQCIDGWKHPSPEVSSTPRGGEA